MLSPANFLILDEPTNHLDIQSKEILEEAIKNYSGTVLFVSHDRYFINTVSTRIIELKDKELYSFIGNYDYYESHKDLIYGVNANISYSETSSVSVSATIASGKQLNFSAVNPDSISPDINAVSNDVSSNKEAYLKNKEEQARLRKRENDLKKTKTKIAEIETKIASIDEEINLPENATSSVKLGELASKHEELDNQLMELYELFYDLEG